MQLDKYFVRLTSLALFNKVEQLVQQSLLGDWIVRIEYGEQKTDEAVIWRQWKSPFFALRDAKSLNEEILNCRLCFPVHPIRLHAEKLNPRTQMIYWVYIPTSITSQESQPERDYADIPLAPLPQQARA